ncbi:MAG TPA: oligosaccharide repeat unit polymerase [Campylobacterales bacterium]|nr:oligosaccharide repeat unit polymerase [Campylobacterales bacterium]
METLLFTLYFIFLILMIRYIIGSVKSGWSILSVFLIFFSIQYLVIPLLFILNSTVFFLKFGVSDLYLNSHGLQKFYSLESLLVVFIFIAFLFAGTWFIKEKSTQSYYFKERTVYIFRKEVSLLFLIGLFLATLSFASLFLYSSAFGGMERAIEVSARVRSGYGSEVWLSQKYIFTKRFIPFSILGIIIFFLLEQRKGLSIWLIFYMSFGVAMFSRFVLFKGKQSMLVLILLYLFYLSLKNKKSYLFHFAIFFLFAIFLLPALDIYLDSKKFVIPEASSFIQQILDMFLFMNFDQVSLEFALQKTYDFFYFENFISGIRGSFIPESWLTNINGNVMLLNTYYFYGREATTVPPGVMAFGYYNLGAIGVAIVAFGTGVLIKKLDYFFMNLLIFNPRLMIVYAFVMTQAFTWARTGMPKYTFYKTTMIVLLITMLIGYQKEPIKENSDAQQ